MAACVGTVALLGRSFLWFVSLPGWFLAVVLYTLASAVVQKAMASRGAEA
jgi:hypothetical protein